MKYETLKIISRDESDFALGKSYLESAALGLKEERSALIAALETRLLNGEASERKAAFYDFLIELGCLTFLLYKWGLLLFHVEQGIFGDFILTIVIDGERAIVVENEGELALERLESGEKLFNAKSNKKSGLYSILLWLAQKNAALEIISIDKDKSRFDGNRVSFSADAAQSDRIALIKTEFFRHKKRLDDLQKLFIDGFGVPRGMSV
ncbi:MAG: hypothetical protein LBF86_00335 [Helicobacteraceae bacterium]|jgi:hypothetical protein|nr:hypothetical protein [Helicobacteraceae bacterium]